MRNNDSKNAQDVNAGSKGSLRHQKSVTLSLSKGRTTPSHSRKTICEIIVLKELVQFETTVSSTQEVMGKSASKPSNEKPRMVSRAKMQGSDKHVRLLVLHRNDTEPRSETYKLRGAIDDHPPPGTLNVDDFRISKIPDNGQLEESDKTWVSEWLGKGRVVLVWLLAEFNVNAALGNDDKIVVTSTTPDNIDAELDDIVATIKARGQ